MFRISSAAAAIALGCAFCAAPRAEATGLTINATFASSITADPQAAAIEATINQVVSFYDNLISTPITVNITYGEMSTGLGQSSTFYGTITYSQYLAALTAHSSGDATDLSALASLPNTSANPVDGSTSIDVTTANLRALGFNAVVATDSTVSVNTSITNYVGGAPYNPSDYSLLAVLEHETDEALGLGSDLDTGLTTGAIRPEDLFRYSAAGVRSYSTSSSASSYFSVNGGVTDLIAFNQTGGGADYGDWASSSTAHVQDAFGTPGATPVFGVEGIALDAIGYNLTTAAVAPTPEPSGLVLLGTGALGVVGAVRRRMLA